MSHVNDREDPARSPQTLLAELEHEARQTPSSERWARQICPRLDRFTVEDYASGRLAKVEARLMRWPAKDRAVHYTWIDGLLRGQPLPQVRLAGNLPLVVLQGAARSADDMSNIDALLNAPGLEHIGILDLYRCPLKGPKLHALLHRPAMARFHTLYLDQKLTLPTAGALATSPHLGALRTLDLTGCARELEPLFTLLRSPLMEHLEALCLAENGLGSLELDRLLDEPGLARLKSLDLRDNQLRDGHITRLAASWTMKGLEHLKLAENLLTDKAAIALAGSKYLANLTWLELGYAREKLKRIGDEGAIALAESPYLTKLEILGLNFQDIGDIGAGALVGSKRLTRLRRLEICYGNYVTKLGGGEIAWLAPRDGRLKLNLEPDSRLYRNEALRASILMPDEDEFRE